MAKHSGLGKGLAALIPGDDTSSPGTGATLLDPSQILPNPRQPRTIFGQQEIEELADSIRENGIIQPLIVSPGNEPGQYFLIAGERRLMASRVIGLTQVPVIIRDVNELQQLELALVENVQRKDLTPLETAEAYHQLAEEFSLSHEIIAKMVGKSRVTVTNSLRLLKLPEKVKLYLNSGQLSEGHARVLLALPTPVAQEAAATLTVQKNLNVRQVEKLVQDLIGQKPAAPKKPEHSSQIADIEETLRQSLGTKVQLNYSKHGGSIVIRYYSDEELNALIQKITGK